LIFRKRLEDLAPARWRRSPRPLPQAVAVGRLPPADERAVAEHRRA